MGWRREGGGQVPLGAGPFPNGADLGRLVNGTVVSQASALIITISPDPGHILSAPIADVLQGSSSSPIFSSSNLQMKNIHHLDVSIDGRILAVCAENELRFLTVANLSQHPIRSDKFAADVIDFAFSPTSPGQFALATADGAVHIGESNSSMSSVSISASSCCWAVGSATALVCGHQDGSLSLRASDSNRVQYQWDRAMPAPITFVKSITATIILIGCYSPDEAIQLKVLTLSNKIEESKLVDVEDWFTGSPPECRIRCQVIIDWGLVLLSTSATTEIAAFTLDPETGTLRETVNDDGESILFESVSDSVACVMTGMAIDFSCARSSLVGQRVRRPVPSLLVTSSEGVVDVFHIVGDADLPIDRLLCAAPRGPTGPNDHVKPAPVGRDFPTLARQSNQPGSSVHPKPQVEVAVAPRLQVDFRGFVPESDIEQAFVKGLQVMSDNLLALARMAAAPPSTDLPIQDLVEQATSCQQRLQGMLQDLATQGLASLDETMVDCRAMLARGRVELAAHDQYREERYSRPPDEKSVALQDAIRTRIGELRNSLENLKLGLDMSRVQRSTRPLQLVYTTINQNAALLDQYQDAISQLEANFQELMAVKRQIKVSANLDQPKTVSPVREEINQIYERALRYVSHQNRATIQATDGENDQWEVNLDFDEIDRSGSDLRSIAADRVQQNLLDAISEEDAAAIAAIFAPEEPVTLSPVPSPPAPSAPSRSFAVTPLKSPSFPSPSAPFAPSRSMAVSSSQQSPSVPPSGNSLFPQPSAAPFTPSGSFATSTPLQSPSVPSSTVFSSLATPESVPPPLAAVSSVSLSFPVSTTGNASFSLSTPTKQSAPVAQRSFPIIARSPSPSAHEEGSEEVYEESDFSGSEEEDRETEDEQEVLAEELTEREFEEEHGVDVEHNGVRESESAEDDLKPEMNSFFEDQEPYAEEDAAYDQKVHLVEEPSDEAPEPERFEPDESETIAALERISTKERELAQSLPAHDEEVDSSAPPPMTMPVINVFSSAKTTSTPFFAVGSSSPFAAAFNSKTTTATTGFKTSSANVFVQSTKAVFGASTQQQPSTDNNEHPSPNPMVLPTSSFSLAERGSASTNMLAQSTGSVFGTPNSSQQSPKVEGVVSPAVQTPASFFDSTATAPQLTFGAPNQSAKANADQLSGGLTMMMESPAGPPMSFDGFGLGSKPSSSPATNPFATVQQPPTSGVSGPTTSDVFGKPMTLSAFGSSTRPTSNVFAQQTPVSNNPFARAASSSGNSAGSTATGAVFGQAAVFGAMPSQSSGFGSSAFGGNQPMAAFGSSSTFGAASTFGSIANSTPAFGSAQGFGATSNPMSSGFGSRGVSAPAFGSSSATASFSQLATTAPPAFPSAPTPSTPAKFSFNTSNFRGGGSND